MASSLINTDTSVYSLVIVSVIHARPTHTQSQPHAQTLKQTKYTRHQYIIWVLKSPNVSYNGLLLYGDINGRNRAYHKVCRILGHLPFTYSKLKHYSWYTTVPERPIKHIYLAISNVLPVWQRPQSLDSYTCVR